MWACCRLDPATPAVPLNQPGIISIPLSFMVLVVVSLLTGKQVTKEEVAVYDLVTSSARKTISCLKNRKRLSGLTDNLLYRRGGRDSNPRLSFSPSNHLAGGPIQPLWHLPGKKTFFQRASSANCHVYGKIVAEGVGFEPTVGVNPHMFSRHAPSAARSSLQFRLKQDTLPVFPRARKL